MIIPCKTIINQIKFSTSKKTFERKRTSKIKIKYPELTELDIEEIDVKNCVEYIKYKSNKPKIVSVNQKGVIKGKKKGKGKVSVKIKLSDTLAQDYDVYYQAYIENHGWLAYAKNGESAGSSGLSLRMEALQIYIINKYVDFDQGDIAYVTQENVILPPSQGNGTNTNNTKPTCVGTTGINLIKSFEGCILTAYKPVSTEQYYTIGWGHYGADVKKGMRISQTQADNLLLQDLKKYEGYLNNFLNRYNISISQEQYDALLSFTYNLGNQWVKTPTFQLKTILINGANNYTSEQIRTAFTNWNKAGGKVLTGLTRRRNAEAELFLSGM